MKFVKFEHSDKVFKLPDRLDYMICYALLDCFEDHFFNNCDWLHELFTEEEWGEGELGRLQEVNGFYYPDAIEMPDWVAIVIIAEMHIGYKDIGLIEDDPSTFAEVFADKCLRISSEVEAVQDLAVYLSHSLKISRVHLDSARLELELANKRIDELEKENEVLRYNLYDL